MNDCREGDCLGSELEDGTRDRGGQRDRPKHRDDAGRDGPARGTGGSRSRETRTDQGGFRHRQRYGLGRSLRYHGPVRGQVARPSGHGRPGNDRRPGLQRGHQCEKPKPRVARPGRLGSHDRHQSDGFIQPGPLRAAVDAPAGRMGWSFRSARSRACVPARSEAPATRRRSLASRRWGFAWDARKARAAFARR